jgi:CheY-like chemotaxis protein
MTDTQLRTLLPSVLMEYRKATDDRPVTLMIEDNPADVLLIQQALAEHCMNPQLFVASDGEKAIKLLEQIETAALPCPILIILDINLPKRSGLEVLSRIRASRKCADTPVAILTSSNALRDRQEAAQRGATIYLVKPNNLEEFMRLGGKLKSLLP